MISLLPIAGLFSGLAITRLSIDECQNKSWLLRYFLIAISILISISSMPYSLFAISLTVFYMKKWIKPGIIASLILAFIIPNLLSLLLLFINNHLLTSALTVKE